jgi:hypothetical protein
LFRDGKTISAGIEPAAFGNLACGEPEANALPLRHDTGGVAKKHVSMSQLLHRVSPTVT